MHTIIRIGNVPISLTRKHVKHVHLSVHPPDGRVTLVAPKATRTEVARAYAISSLRWIRKKQEEFSKQSRETVRKYAERESHYLWGRRYLLSVAYHHAKPSVSVSQKRIILKVRPGSCLAKRAEVIHEWHKSMLHSFVALVIKRWEPKLRIKVRGYFLQRMKTRWGSCNHKSGCIRLNTELVKKPRDLIEYVIVHEMIHLLEPTHSRRFIELLQYHYPGWCEASNELNERSLSAEIWKRQCHPKNLNGIVAVKRD